MEVKVLPGVDHVDIQFDGRAPYRWPKEEFAALADLIREESKLWKPSDDVNHLSEANARLRESLAVSQGKVEALTAQLEELRTAHEDLLIDLRQAKRDRDTWRAVTEALTDLHNRLESV